MNPTKLELSEREARHLEAEKQRRLENENAIKEANEIRVVYPTFKAIIEGGKPKSGFHFHNYISVFIRPYPSPFYSVCLKCGTFRRQIITGFDMMGTGNLVLGFIDPEKDRYYSSEGA